MKAKPLTTLSIMGDLNSIMFDLSKSLLISYEQALTAKTLLLNEDKITFTDGTNLHLKGRRVKTISLTLYDYGALHTSIFTKEFLELIFRGMNLVTKFQDPSYWDTIKDINKLFDKIRNLGQQISSYNENAIRESIFTHQFLNISLLLQIMHDFDYNVEKFLKAIESMQYINCGMQDSYISYLNIKDIIDD